MQRIRTTVEPVPPRGRLVTPRRLVNVLVVAASGAAGALLGERSGFVVGFVGAGATAVGLVALTRLAGLLSVAVRLRREGPHGPLHGRLAIARRVVGLMGGDAEHELEHGARVSASGGRGGARDSALELERAVVLAPAVSPGLEESVVVAGVERSTPDELRRLVWLLRRAHDDAIDALGSPFGPLHAAAPEVFRAVAVPLPASLGRSVARAHWAPRRAACDPDRAESAIATRLIARGFHEAAARVLERAEARDDDGADARALRRLVRLGRILDVAHGGAADALRDASSRSFADDVVTLAGRRAAGLEPGGHLVRRLGGARALQRVLRRRLDVLHGIAALPRHRQDLLPRVAEVLAFAARRTQGEVATAIASGRLALAVDGGLRAHADGLVCVEDGDWDGAAAAFEVAAARCPDFAAAARGVAFVRRRTGRETDGARALRGFVDRNPGEPTGWTHLAEYLVRIGRRDDAREVYADAVLRLPDALPLRIAFARMLEDVAEFDDAYEQAVEARRRRPNDPWVALLSGRIAFAADRLDDASDALAVAERGLNGPELREARFHRMRVHAALGDHGSAVRLALRLARVLGSGQEEMLDEVAEYLEERHEFLEARAATERARRLRGGG